MFVWFFAYISITVQRNGHCNTSIHIASSHATRWGTKLDPNSYPLGTGPPTPKSRRVTPEHLTDAPGGVRTALRTTPITPSVKEDPAVLKDSDVVFLYTALLEP